MGFLPCQYWSTCRFFPLQILMGGGPNNFRANQGLFDTVLSLNNVKPPFLRDTGNGRNSRNRGVENGKWQVSFSEMIRLIYVQNRSQFGRAFNKMLGKVYLLPTFPSKCCFICLLGHTFAVWMPFSALQWEEIFAELPFRLFAPGEVFLEHCKKFPRFSNFTLLIQKNGKFWSVCTVFW